MESHCTSQDHAHMYHGSLYGEFICHFPYAIASVAFSLAVVGFISYMTLVNNTSSDLVCSSSGVLFHVFHFMHIVFAATGAMVTYFRFSKNVLKGLLVCSISTIVFCIISDVIIPYIGGQLMGETMQLHFCIVHEMHNIVPFLFAGLANGFIMSKHHLSKQLAFSLYSHFVHILVSSFASVFYLISQGCFDWYHQIGFVFIFLLVAVVVPCTLSDLVMPIVVARTD